MGDFILAPPRIIMFILHYNSKKRSHFHTMNFVSIAATCFPSQRCLDLIDVDVDGSDAGSTQSSFMVVDCFALYDWFTS